MMNKRIILLFSLSFLLSYEKPLSFPFKVTEYKHNDTEIEDKEEDKNFNGVFPRKLFEIPTKYVDDFRAEINLCLGTPPQCFDFTIQTDSFFLWIPSKDSRSLKSEKKFDQKLSSTIVRNMTDLEIVINHQALRGTQAKDLLTFNSLDLTRINFLIAYDADRFLRHFGGMLGLGYTPKKFERKFSIIQQLFENGVIPHKVFSQKYTDEKKGVISFGEIPKHIVEDYQNYGRCKAVDKVKKGLKYKNKSWQCMVNGISFDGTQSHITLESAKVSFLSYRNRCFMPKSILAVIEKLFFEQYFSQNKCEKVIERGRWNVINCDLDINLPNMNLEFDEWILPIPGDKLFKKIEGTNKKQFIFVNNPHQDKMILGRSVLSTFEMVYDYANHEVGFYKKGVIYKGTNKPEKPKIYEFLEEEPGFRPGIVNPPFDIFPKYRPVPRKEEEQEQEIKGDESVTSLASVVKKIFSILIFIGIICIVFFFILYAIRYNQRQKISVLKTQLGNKLVSSNQIEGK